MKRTLPRLLGVIVIAVLSNTTVKAVAIHKTVHAATSATPYVIAVLSDHYTDQDEFDNDVANFITYGLLAHPYYAAHAADLQVESFYEPLAAGTKSNYGFDVDVPSANCVLSWTISSGPTNTATRVGDVVSGVNPEHTLVIGDHPYNIGCTDGEWTYVGVDAAGSDVLPHELGHGIASLYDEWFPGNRAGVSHPGIPLADSRNCYDTRHGPTPPWTFPGAGSVQGCDLFELNVVHAYGPMYNGKHYCLMGATSNAEFCPVCVKYMEDAFGYLENPDSYNPDIDNPDLENPDVQNPNKPAPNAPTGLRIVKTAFVMQEPTPKPVPPAPKPVVPAPAPQPGAALKPGTAQPIIRLLVSFDPATGVMTPKKAFPITARYVPSHRRLGVYVYEIADRNQIIDVGVLPSRLFRSHNYQGGTAHSTSDAHPADVTIQIPIENGWLRDPNHAISIRIYRLAPNVVTPLITPTVFAALKADKRTQSLGEMDAAQILNVMPSK
jgi:hypothetical protein